MLMTVCGLAQIWKARRLTEHMSSQVMMRTVGRLEQVNDQYFLLGRVVRTARGYSSEANQRCETFENAEREAIHRRQNP